MADGTLNGLNRALQSLDPQGQQALAQKLQNLTPAQLQLLNGRAFAGTMLHGGGGVPGGQRMGGQPVGRTNDEQLRMLIQSQAVAQQRLAQQQQQAAAQAQAQQQQLVAAAQQQATLLASLQMQQQDGSGMQFGNNHVNQQQLAQLFAAHNARAAQQQQQQQQQQAYSTQQSMAGLQNALHALQLLNNQGGASSLAGMQGAGNGFNGGGVPYNNMQHVRSNHLAAAAAAGAAAALANRQQINGNSGMPGQMTTQQAASLAALQMQGGANASLANLLQTTALQQQQRLNTLQQQAAVAAQQQLQQQQQQQQFLMQQGQNNPQLMGMQQFAQTQQQLLGNNAAATNALRIALSNAAHQHQPNHLGNMQLQQQQQQQQQHASEAIRKAAAAAAMGPPHRANGAMGGGRGGIAASMQMHGVEASAAMLEQAVRMQAMGAAAAHAGAMQGGPQSAAVSSAVAQLMAAGGNAGRPPGSPLGPPPSMAMQMPSAGMGGGGGGGTGGMDRQAQPMQQLGGGGGAGNGNGNGSPFEPANAARVGVIGGERRPAGGSPNAIGGSDGGRVAASDGGGSAASSPEDGPSNPVAALRSHISAITGGAGRSATPPIGGPGGATAAAPVDLARSGLVLPPDSSVERSAAGNLHVPPADAEAFLQAVGRRLAAANITLEQALNAGILGGLSAGQVKLLTEAYEAECLHLRARGGSAADNSNSSGPKAAPEGSLLQPLLVLPGGASEGGGGGGSLERRASSQAGMEVGKGGSMDGGAREATPDQLLDVVDSTDQEQQLRQLQQQQLQLQQQQHSAAPAAADNKDGGMAEQQAPLAAQQQRLPMDLALAGLGAGLPKGPLPIGDAGGLPSLLPWASQAPTPQTSAPGVQFNAFSYDFFGGLPEGAPGTGGNGLEAPPLLGELEPEGSEREGSRAEEDDTHSVRSVRSTVSAPGSGSAAHGLASTWGMMDGPGNGNGMNHQGGDASSAAVTPPLSTWGSGLFTGLGMMDTNLQQARPGNQGGMMLHPGGSADESGSLDAKFGLGNLQLGTGF